MVSKNLVHAITEMQEEEAVHIVTEALETGTDPLEIIDACRTAMNEIGNRFEAGQAFIPELIMAGEIMTRITGRLKPYMADSQANVKKARVLMGTVQGDIHNIGKDIVVFMLEVNGYEVIDLGVDVSPQTFVENIQTHQPDVVGLSGLLTVALDAMKNTVAAIDSAGLRDRVKIMIGGAPVDQKVQAYTSADDWGKDAVSAVSLVKHWMGD